ncbi:MAG: hypothetical protein Q9181_003800 [Wetmoreana brouardii]
MEQNIPPSTHQIRHQLPTTARPVSASTGSKALQPVHSTRHDQLPKGMEIARAESTKLNQPAYISEPLSMKRKRQADDPSQQLIDQDTLPRVAGVNTEALIRSDYKIAKPTPRIYDGHGHSMQMPEKPTDAMTKRLEAIEARTKKLDPYGGDSGMTLYPSSPWIKTQSSGRLGFMDTEQQTEKRLQDLDEKKRKLAAEIEENQTKKRKIVKDWHYGEHTGIRYPKEGHHQERVGRSTDRYRPPPPRDRPRSQLDLPVDQLRYKPLREMTTLREVEDVLASLNRRINHEVAHWGANTLEHARLVQEQNRVRQRRLEIDVARQAPRVSQVTQPQSARDTHLETRENDTRAITANHLPKPKIEASTTKARPSDARSEDQTEVMVDIVSLFGRITKRLGDLQKVFTPVKERKGAVTGLSIALLANAKELLAKTREVTGEMMKLDRSSQDKVGVEAVSNVMEHGSNGQAP